MNLFLSAYLDGEWEDLTPYVKHDTLKIKWGGMSDDFHAVKSTASAELIYDPDLHGTLMALLDYTPVRILDDLSNVIFFGEFPPPRSFTYTGVVGAVTSTLAMIDLTRQLEVPVGDVAWWGMKVLDPANPTLSLVHQLVALAGWSYARVSNVPILDTILAFAPTNQDDSVYATLNTLLHEYGYVFNLDNVGNVTPIQWQRTDSPSFVFNDDTILEQAQFDFALNDNQGAEVTVYEAAEHRGSGTGILVYMDTDLSYDDTGARAGVDVPPGYKYPFECNVIDPVTGLPTVVEQEYTDAGISYYTNKAVVQGLDYNLAAFSSDFSGIIATKEWRLDSAMDAGLVITKQDFYNKHAEIIVNNGTGTHLFVRGLNVYATVAYRKTKRVLGISNTGTTTKVSKYEMTYCNDPALANAYLTYLDRFNRIDNGTFTLYSAYDVPISSFVTVTLAEGTSNDGVILAKDFDPYRDKYSYTIRTISDEIRLANYSRFFSSPLTVLEDQPTSSLTTYSTIAASEADGSSPDMSSSFTDFIIKRGATDITEQASFTSSTTGLVGSLGTGAFKGRFTASGFTSDLVTTGYAVITATLGDGSVIEHTYTVTKAKQGVRGEAGPSGSTAFTAGYTPPASPTTGMTWLNLTDGMFYVWSGAAWEPQDSIVPANTDTETYVSMDDYTTIEGNPDLQVVDNFNGAATMRGINTPTPSSTSVNGGGLSLSGTDQYLQSAVGIDTRYPYTVSIWAKATPDATLRYAIYQNHPVAGAFSFGVTALGKVWALAATSVDYPVDDAWHHFVLTNDTVTALLYLDGTHVATIPYTSFPSYVSGTAPYDNAWAGSLDEYRLDARVWSILEVRGAYFLRGFTKQFSLADFQRTLIASDGVVTPEEKQALKREWLLIYDNAADPIDLSGSALGGSFNTTRIAAEVAGLAASTYYSDFLAAAETLRGLLFDLPGVLHTTKFDKNVAVSDTFIEAWKVYYGAEYELQSQTGATNLEEVAVQIESYLGIIVPDFSSGGGSGYELYTVKTDNSGFDAVVGTFTASIGDFGFVRHFNGGTADAVKRLYAWNGSGWATASIGSSHRSKAASDLMAICKVPGYGTPTAGSNSDAFQWFDALVANEAFIDTLAARVLKSANYGSYGGADSKKTEIDLNNAKQRQWVRNTANTGDLIVETSSNGFSIVSYLDTPIAATAMVAGSWYEIISVGTTDFTSYGADANVVGSTFLASAPGAGTGTIKLGSVKLLADRDGNIQIVGGLRGGDRYDKDGVTVDTAKPGFFLAATGECRVAGITFEGTQGGGVQWGVPYEKGTSLSLSSLLGNFGVASLSGSSVAVYNNGSAAVSSRLATYRWTGLTWVLVGTALTGIEAAGSNGTGNICAVNSTTVALTTTTSTLIRIFTWNGSTWVASGATYNMGTSGVNGLASLSDTDFVVANSGNLSGRGLTTYRWNGSTITQVGNFFGVSSMGAGVSISTLRPNTVVAYEVSPHLIKVYSFDGTDWSHVGTDLDVGVGSSAGAVAALNSTDIVHCEITSDLLRLYRWDGDIWTAVSSAASAGTTSGYMAISALNGADFAFLDSTGRALRMYGISFATSVPLRL